MKIDHVGYLTYDIEKAIKDFGDIVNNTVGLTIGAWNVQFSDRTAIGHDYRNKFCDVCTIG